MIDRILVFACTAALGLAAAPSAAACEARPDSRPASSAPAAARGGLIAFVDTKTGELVVPPPAMVDTWLRDGHLMTALSTSSEGLVEVKRPTGGYGVDLQGRFQSATIATVGTDGTLKMGHASLLPAAKVPAAGAAAEVTK